MTKQLIEIKMPKCTLFFTQQELQQLLPRDPRLVGGGHKAGEAHFPTPINI